MADETCNGWANRATWAVNLHLSCEQYYSELLDEWSCEVWNDAEACETFSRLENATFAMADRIKDEVESQIDEFFGDKVSTNWAAMLVRDLMDDDVNWYEIAKHYVEEHDRRVTAELEAQRR